MMVGMAGLQVLVVRFFFQGARKGMLLYLVIFQLGMHGLTDTLSQVMYKICPTEGIKCSASVHGVGMETATSRLADDAVMNPIQHDDLGAISARQNIFINSQTSVAILLMLHHTRHLSRLRCLRPISILNHLTRRRLLRPL